MMTWLPDSQFTRGDPSRLPALRDSRHVDGVSPERHATSVEKHFGDWYAICHCQARSLPCWNQAAAARWVCPRAEAEAEVMRAKLRWDARAVDAGNWGRS